VTRCDRFYPLSALHARAHVGAYKGKRVTTCHVSHPRASATPTPNAFSDLRMASKREWKV
jgi:hypothetical protein